MLTNQSVRELLSEQLQSWEMARRNYEALDGVEEKCFGEGKSQIKVQFNPARITSSAAKVDANSLLQRKCFLCPNNLPDVQRGILFADKYQLLVNPFPIFPQHFTIPLLAHTEQRILPYYRELLQLSKTLDEFTFFYNGPKCGASAPDHAHFQAGNRGFLPIEGCWRLMIEETLLSLSKSSLYLLREESRSAIVIESALLEEAVNLFEKAYFAMEIEAGEDEPMMNLLVWRDGEKWISILFPRAQHRPSCYYEEGEGNLLISPASVDMGGVFITPLQKDFEKITSVDLQRILREVCLSDEEMNRLVKRLKNSL